MLDGFKDLTFDSKTWLEGQRKVFPLDKHHLYMRKYFFYELQKNTVQ